MNPNPGDTKDPSQGYAGIIRLNDSQSSITTFSASLKSNSVAGSSQLAISELNYLFDVFVIQEWSISKATSSFELRKVFLHSLLEMMLKSLSVASIRSLYLEHERGTGLYFPSCFDQIFKFSIKYQISVNYEALMIFSMG